MNEIELNNGQKMPAIGFGTAFGGGGEPPDSLNTEGYIEAALEAGYRHFDTAYLYRTEKPLGSVLKRWIRAGRLQREDVFVVTKLPSIGMYPEKVHHFLQLSLNNLQLEYVDLYLIHWPIGLVYRTDDQLVPKDADGQIIYDHTTNLELIWKEMETLVDLGLANSIGVSNFSVKQIQRVCKVARILPALLQVETNVYIQQRELRETCARHNIHVTAYAPLGSPSRVLERIQPHTQVNVNMDVDVNGNSQSKPVPAPDLLLHADTVLAIAKKHGKTPAQIALRFLTQQNISVIPKTRSLERMVENINSMDFDLDEDDMAKLRVLDKGTSGRVFDYFPGGRKHPEYPFGLIDDDGTAATTELSLRM